MFKFGMEFAKSEVQNIGEKAHNSPEIAPNLKSMFNCLF